MNFISCIVIVLSPLLSQAQVNQMDTPVSVTEQLPNFTVHNIVNYKTDSVVLANLKKPLLLDFFGTFCSGCISALPYLNTQQTELGDSIQIMVVCREPKEKILKFLQTNPLVKNIRLPFITSDSILAKLFPHKSIPHEVWIDEKAIVQAITIADYVNKENLQKLVAGHPLHLPVKSDAQRYNPILSLKDNALATQSSILFRSTITGYVNNAGRGFSGTFLSEDGNYKRRNFINMSPMTLCMAALDYRFPLNRFILEIQDSSKLAHVNKQQYDWFVTHALGYEICFLSSISLQEVERYILSDIAAITGTHIRIKKRVVPCYILVRNLTHEVKDPRSKGGKPATVFNSENGQSAYVHNGYISSIVKAMNAGSFDKPQPIVIDESGYTLPVDINLGVTNIRDISAMQQVLRQYGFSLTSATRELDMVLITDL